MAEQVHRFVYALQEPGQRLDVWLATTERDLSRSRIQSLVREGQVLVNGAVAKAHQKLHPGDRVEVAVPEPVPPVPRPEAIPLQVLYEDRWLIVVNKPTGMVVHPGAGNRSGTLVNALLHHCSDLSGIGGVERPGIVHRLDKETSGLLVVAKDDSSHRALARQWERRTIERRYLALVKGRVRKEIGTIEAPIGRHPIARKRMAVVGEKGKAAITEYRVLERFPHFTFLEARLRTGRTHQIRVHLAHLGHPVVGDVVYGRRTGKGGSDAAEVAETMEHLPGMALHAATLGFIHPEEHSYLEFQAPLPQEFTSLLEALRRDLRRLPSGDLL